VRRTLTIAEVALAGLGAAPAAALTTTRQAASSGAVSAVFSFNGKAPNYSSLRLKITRSGTVFYDRPVVASLPHTCGAGCWPAAVGHGMTSVHVLDLEHDGQPDVLLDLYTGGAHCCFVEQVYSYDPGAQIYTRTEHNFEDPGAQVKDLGHNARLEFLSRDPAFGNAFADFAASGMPIQIWTFADRRFSDVTRHYPQLIAKDAAAWLKDYRSAISVTPPDDEGLIAAWAADEYLLGHGALVKSTLTKEQNAGHLKGPFESGAKFVADLNRFLRKNGYEK
jgi:hypothetical protein